MALERKLVLWCGVSDFTEIKKEIFKNLLVPNHKGKSFHIWHVASFSGPLPKYFNGPGVEISPMLWGLGFKIAIKKEFFKKNLLVPNGKG